MRLGDECSRTRKTPCEDPELSEPEIVPAAEDSELEGSWDLFSRYFAVRGFVLDLQRRYINLYILGHLAYIGREWKKRPYRGKTGLLGQTLQ